MKTLLEEAKNTKINRTRKEVSREEAELFVSLLKDEISVAQVRSVLFPNDAHNTGGGRVYARAFPALRVAYKLGLIK